MKTILLKKLEKWTGIAFVLALIAVPVSAQTPPSASDIAQALSRLAAIEQRLTALEKQAGIKATEGDAANVDARLEALDQNMRIAERKRELDQDAATAKAADAPVLTAGPNGFALQSNNGDYTLALGLAAQTDGRFSLNSTKPFTNTFTLRKIRPTLTGRAGKYFAFKVMPDFGGGGTIVQDAYFDIKFFNAFRIRSGKDKTPIGYELLTGDSYLLFPERSIASSLVPNRDIGIQAQGDLFKNRVFYSVGVMNGIPDGSSTTSELDTNNGKDLAGRVVVQPFKSANTPNSVLNGLGFQIGGSEGQQFGALPTFKTSVGQAFFSYAATASAGGQRRRVTPAVFYYYKSLGAFAEFFQSTQGVTKSNIQTHVTNRGGEITGSIVLTGETATDRGIKPKNNFDPAKGKWGALQLVGRYTTLIVDRDSFTAGLAAATANRRAKSFTAGANWYPNSFIKYYVTYERTVFSGNAVRVPENVILFRTQLAF